MQQGQGSTANRWVSVDDHMPADNVDVLVYIRWQVTIGTVVGDYHIAHRMPAEGWVTRHSQLNVSRNVTHWRMLPSPPGSGPEMAEQLAEQRIRSIQERLRLVNEYKPIDGCPICESHTFVDEQVCCSDYPEMPEYWVICSGGCGFQYTIYGGLEIREKMIERFGEHFASDSRVDRYLAEKGNRNAGTRDQDDHL